MKSACIWKRWVRNFLLRCGFRYKIKADCYIQRLYQRNAAYILGGADKRTYVHWAEKKYDVMVFGMPQFFHYADGMGTNPIMMIQALSAQVIRHKRVIRIAA